MRAAKSAELMALEAVIVKRVEQLEKLWESVFKANGGELKLFVVMAIGSAPDGGQSEGGYVSGCSCVSCRVGLVFGMQRLLSGRDPREGHLH